MVDVSKYIFDTNQDLQQLFGRVFHEMGISSQRSQSSGASNGFGGSPIVVGRHAQASPRPLAKEEGCRLQI
jgi:hypothetical protein